MIKKFFLLIIFYSFLGFSQNLWIDLSESKISYIGERVIIPESYRVLKLNTELIKDYLKSAPMEFTSEAHNNPAIIELPFPDGSFQKFKFWESPTMEPELQNEFTEIRTYTGQGIDDPYATLKMDFTPQGFHAMILSPNGRVFIDPYAKGDINYYLSYYSKDYTKKDELFECEVLYHDEYIKPVPNFYETLLTPTGPQLRTYRLANAATGEYTQYHGGTVASGLAAVTTSVNRVNGVYEREAAIRMVLVANNNLIIYTDPNTDPYTNNNGSVMLSQNISNLNAVIGSSNYDIGHVFSTGGGGIAYFGCVCTSNKAGGVTGSPNPIGDPFDIDYVAHEMGHQFGANHTFNGNTGSCSGNRNASTAYEPGSGSTIMAYAGICAPQNLQSNSDAYFHTISFDEIVAFTNSGSGNSCAQITNTGNNAPSITVPTGGFYIPKSTPFALSGSATDPNGDALTYCWEEFDLGP
ncbi:MAG: reprolysin-like metallopeptidase, partial [Ignavibacterium sp.]